MIYVGIVLIKSALSKINNKPQPVLNVGFTLFDCFMVCLVLFTFKIGLHF